MPGGRHQRRPGEPDAGDPPPAAEPTEEPTEEPTGDWDEQPADWGPWDSRAPYPQRERIDLGSLQLPVNPGQEIHLELTGDQTQIIAASVTTPGGKLQVRALAAPKTGGLWQDERDEIAEAITNAGGQAQVAEGPFGIEVVVQEPPEPGSPQATLQPARYLGVDGPRWLLCGKISGPAAVRPELAAPLEEVFAGIVVVRGDHPAPPRDLLEIQLPPQMREAIAQQMAEAAQQPGYPNPFERGPEITETR